MKVAIIGGETLIGRELQEVLGSVGTGIETITFSASGEGSFGEEEGEAVYLQPLAAASIQDFKAVLIAGSRVGALKAYDLAKEAGGRPLVVDCTGELEDQQEARICAPLLHYAVQKSWLQVIAHPAAGALALVLTRLAGYSPIQRSLAHIFEPASERGKRGITELHQQTTSLLSFKGLDREVFDAQLSFNLLPQYGEEAPLKLAAVEHRIERDLATLIDIQTAQRVVPMPSLRLIQAPVFHGYSFSIWVEFERAVNARLLGEALASAQIEIRGETEEAPNAVGAAGQSGLIAGDIRVDTNNARAAWLWVVGDNLRMLADAASALLVDVKEVRQ